MTESNVNESNVDLSSVLTDLNCHAGRFTRSAVKRVLSMDDLNTLSHSQPADDAFIGRTSGAYVVTNSKRRRKFKQPSSQTLPGSSQQHSLSQNDAANRQQLYDEVINDVVNKTCNDNNDITDRGYDCETSAAIINQNGNVTMSSDVFDSIIGDINSLKTTVSALRNQLNFVLSFLGITDNSLLSNVDFPPLKVTSAIISQSDSNSGSSRRTVDGENSITVSDQNNQSQSTTRPSYANTVQGSSLLSVPLRNAVISAVYSDFEEKDRRAKNIVISGLSPSTSSSDKTLIENLCHTEFQLNPHIVKCRRLGKPSSDRVQPILVVFQTVHEADFLIKNAKRLRQSSNPTVKISVYINPDLTKAESLAAYRRRCRRRDSKRSVQSVSANTVEVINDAIPQSIPVLNSRVSASQAASAKVTPLSVDDQTNSTVEQFVQDVTDNTDPDVVNQIVTEGALSAAVIHDGITVDSQTEAQAAVSSF